MFKDRDPAAVFFSEKAFEFSKQDGRTVLSIRVPFIRSGEIDLLKNGDELILGIGSWRRYVAMPRRMAALEPSDATLEDGTLRVVFGGSSDGEDD